MSEPLLDIKGLTMSFGGLVAVDGVDLSVNTGEIVGLIGPNGAGKTTVFNCISRFYEPDRGTIHVQGPRHHPRPVARDHPLRHRAHVPERGALSQHDDTGEPAGRTARGHARGRDSRWLAPARSRRGRSPRDRARRRDARAPGPHGPSRPRGLHAALPPPEAGRAGPGARLEAGPAACSTSRPPAPTTGRVRGSPT